MTPRLSTQVGIIGAGPAGLVAAHVLLRSGIDCCVVERNTREQVEQRARAGLREHRVADYLRGHGLPCGRSTSGAADFVCEDQRIRVSYRELSGGFTRWVHPQQLLVRDLLTALDTVDRSPRFGCAALAISAPLERPVIECADLDLACDFVLACDGSGGPSARLFAAAGLPPTTRRHRCDWLTVLADVERPVDGAVYALHRDGFAGLMPRAGTTARLYLQIPAGGPLESWRERDIRDRFARRMGTTAPLLPALREIAEVGVVRMRSSSLPVARLGKLLVAGDAAHLLTPTGAKGMNLAIADAADAAHSLISWYHHGDPGDLAGYSARRVEDARLTQEFSGWMLDLLHVPSGPEVLSGKRETIESIAVPGPAGEAFAHRYAGSGAGADNRVPLPEVGVHSA